MQQIERVIVDYFEGLGVPVQYREGEWLVEIEGCEVSLTGLAFALMFVQSGN